MNADKFQRDTKTTAVYPGDAAFYYLALGLAGEAGEVANKVKRVLQDGREYPSEIEKDAIIDEIGDCLWYCAQLSGYLGTPLSMVMRLNQEKLRARKQLGLLTRRSNGCNTKQSR